MPEPPGYGFPQACSLRPGESHALLLPSSPISCGSDRSSTAGIKALGRDVEIEQRSSTSDQILVLHSDTANSLLQMTLQ
jgi:hypothetical protein